MYVLLFKFFAVWQWLLGKARCRLQRAVGLMEEHGGSWSGSPHLGDPLFHSTSIPGLEEDPVILTSEICSEISFIIGEFLCHYLDVE